MLFAVSLTLFLVFAMNCQRTKRGVGSGLVNEIGSLEVHSSDDLWMWIATGLAQNIFPMHMQ